MSCLPILPAVVTRRAFIYRSYKKACTPWTYFHAGGTIGEFAWSRNLRGRLVSVLALEHTAFTRCKQHRCLGFIVCFSGLGVSFRQISLGRDHAIRELSAIVTKAEVRSALHCKGLSRRISTQRQSVLQSCGEPSCIQSSKLQPMRA